MTVAVDEETMTLAEFKRRFQKRFMSAMAQSVLIRKFAELEQGEMTVPEYAGRFEELARYGYTPIDTVIKRNEKFIKGLKPKLDGATLPHIRDLCDMVVEIALRHEGTLTCQEKNKEKEV